MTHNNRLKFLLIFWLLFFTLLTLAQQTDQFYLITLNYKKVMFAESLSLIDLDIVKSSQDYGYEQGTDYRLEVISSNNQLLQTLEFGLTSKTNNINFTISVPLIKLGANNISF